FTGTASTEIYSLSLHDALPIFNSATFENWLEAHNSDLDFLVLVGTPSRRSDQNLALHDAYQIRQQKIVSHLLGGVTIPERHVRKDRKSTRLNSSHVKISYAVFC